MPFEARAKIHSHLRVTALERLRRHTVLRDKINDDLKGAMKAGDKRRVSTLRMVNSTLKNADIEARGQGKEPLSDADVLGQFQKMIKQRQESLDIYQKAGRTDLATQEKEEIDIISAYLPQQMPEHEIAHVVAELLKELGAQGMKDMGRTMGALKERFSGKMDFAKAGAVVKRLLSSMTHHKEG